MHSKRVITGVLLAETYWSLGALCCAVCSKPAGETQHTDAENKLTLNWLSLVDKRYRDVCFFAVCKYLAGTCFLIQRNKLAVKFSCFTKSKE